MFDELTAEQRARAVYYFFGWQGGTVHQLAKATGLSTDDILYRKDSASECTDGFSAIRTCDRDWRRDVLAPKHQGDWKFWRDAMKGFWATGPLDKTV